MPTRDAALHLQTAADAVLRRGPSWAAASWAIDRERLEDDLEIVEQFPGRILEVGSSPYIATLALKLSGREVVGVDIDPSEAPSGIEVIACDIEREPLPFPDQSFDIVLFSEVFEHLRIDPLFTMSELQRILQPTGFLLLTTPNLRSLRGVLRLVLRGKGWAVGADPLDAYRRLETHGFMGHVREYTANEVRRLLEGVGYSVEEVIWRRKPGNPIFRLLEQLFPALRPYMTLIATPNGV